MGHMNGRWRNLLWAASLGTALAGVTVTSGCVVRMQGHAGVVADSEPPADQYEEVPSGRSGYVWVRGHWEWQNGQWVWQRGSWQRERASYAWVDGHWERRGNRYHWIEGYWQPVGGGQVTTNPQPGVEVHDHSRPAPPPPQNPKGTVQVGTSKPAPPPEPVEQRPNGPAGYIWVKGYWVWSGSQFEWKKGHWERSQANRVWVDGHWERAGGDYVWRDGYWK